MACGAKSRHEHGYDYAWVKVRNAVMERNGGECQPSKRACRFALANAADCIVSKNQAARQHRPPFEFEGDLLALPPRQDRSRAEEDEAELKARRRTIRLTGLSQDSELSARRTTATVAVARSIDMRSHQQRLRARKAWRRS